MKDKEALEKLVKKDIKGILENSNHLKKLYESGKCKIHIFKIYVGPGEYLMFDGPAAALLSEERKKELFEKKGSGKKVTLLGHEACVEAGFFYPVSQGLAYRYSLIKSDTGWEIEGKEITGRAMTIGEVDKLIMKNIMSSYSDS